MFSEGLVTPGSYLETQKDEIELLLEQAEIFITKGYELYLKKGVNHKGRGARIVSPEDLRAQISDPECIKRGYLVILRLGPTVMSTEGLVCVDVDLKWMWERLLREDVLPLLGSPVIR